MWRSGELHEHAQNPLDTLFERVEEGHDFALARRTLVDRYRTGQKGIYAYVRARVGDEYVAVFYRPLGTGKGDLPGEPSGVATPGSPRKALATAKRRCLSIRSRSWMHQSEW